MPPTHGESAHVTPGVCISVVGVPMESGSEPVSHHVCLQLLCFMFTSLWQGVKDGKAQPAETTSVSKAGWLKKCYGRFLGSYKERYISVERTEIVVYENEVNIHNNRPESIVLGRMHV